MVNPGTGCYEPTISGVEVRVSLDRPNFFTQVPAQWEGLPFIRSDLFPIGNPNDVGCAIGDGSLKDYRLSFTLSTSAHVYVAWDPCGNGVDAEGNEVEDGPPDWLSETEGDTYRKMPDQLWFMPRGKPCSGDVLYLERAWDVYRTRVPVPVGDFTTEGYCSAAQYIVFAEAATALPPETVCDDMMDSDDDGFTDCDDPDCAAAQNCLVETLCDNDMDDDMDGTTDCQDPDCVLSLDCAPKQIPGNCNLDASLDLSDVVHLLGFLFQGTPDELPCGTQEANLALMDANGDAATGGGVDLSDAVYLLAFLFQGGPPHDQGDGCVDMPDCPSNEACP